MKKMKYLFLVFSMLSLANGIAFLFFSDQSILLLGGEITSISKLIMRYYGAIALGSGVAIFIFRRVEDKFVQNGLVIGIFICMLASSIVGVSASVTGGFPNFDWLFIFIDITLTIWSGYFILNRFKKVN